MKTLLLHVGLHKTGSTTIQKSFYKNKSFLNRYGIGFPVFKLNDKSYYNHSKVFKFIFNNKTLCKRIELLSVISEFVKCIMNSMDFDTIFVSGEEISTLNTDELESVKQLMESLGLNIKVVCIVRSPLSYFISAVQQRVKAGLVIENCRYGLVSTKLTNISTVFESAGFYSFSDVCQKFTGPTEFMLNQLDINMVDDFFFLDSNVSLSNFSVRFFSYINKNLGKYFTVLSGEEVFAVKSICGEKFTLLRPELEKYIDCILDDNYWLEKNYGLGFCDSENNLRIESFTDKARFDFNEIRSTLLTFNLSNSFWLIFDDFIGHIENKT